MARKVTVQRSNTISTWKTKTQTMSNYIGDLDDLGLCLIPILFFHHQIQDKILV